MDLDSGVASLVKSHTPAASLESLRRLVSDAVDKRIPSDGEPLGLFLSGGLDSSIVAALASARRPDLVAYSLSEPDSPDHRFARLVADALGLQDVRIIAPPTPADLAALIDRVVYATESFNPSIISNGLCTYLLARAAHEDGIKVVLTGEGADELFCGYHRFAAGDAWRRTRERLIDDMHFTELRRLDACSMAHAVEARCPFLDRAVRAYSEGLDYAGLFEERPSGLLNKMALRMAFDGRLPRTVLYREKTSFDVGSGVRRQVVRFLRRNGRSEKAELEKLWRKGFTYDARQPYFHSYPVFDRVIATRGATHR